MIPRIQFTYKFGFSNIKHFDSLPAFISTDSFKRTAYSMIRSLIKF